MTKLQTVSPQDGFIVRPAKGIAEAKQLWWAFMQSLGWNRSSYDLETYTASTSSSGLLLVLPNSTSRPQGHAMATIFDNSTGWVTMFIVDEKHRGLGYGRALFRAVMDEFALSKTKYVGLDGVAEQKQTYQRRGFVESPLGTIRCMSRNLVTHTAIDPADITTPGYQLVDIRDVPVSLLVQSDLAHTGFERKKLWTPAFFNRPDCYGVALTKDKHSRASIDQGELLAWVVVRRASLGYRFGPIYATDSKAAACVLRAAMLRATPELIRCTPMDGESTSEAAMNSVVDTAQLTVEVWCGNPAAVALFDNLGWKSIGVDYHRMWLNGTPTKEQDEGGLAHEGMFAIFDAAIG